MPAKGLLRELRQSLVDALENDIQQAESFVKVFQKELNTK